MGRHTLPGLLMLAVLLGGCSADERRPREPQPHAGESSPTSSAPDGAFPDGLVDRAFADGRAGPPGRSRLPRSLPADPPADAVSLLDSPPGRATMVVEWDPWTGGRHSDDVVHFYGLDRRWYRLDISELAGLDGAPYGEGGAVGALSPDGRTWCEEFGDRLLVLDLATGSQKVVPLPYDSEGVAPRWSTSGDEIVVRERSRRDRTVRIDPHTGDLTAARWDAYTTVVTEAGAHHFATTREGSDDVTVVSRGGGRPTSRVVLDAQCRTTGGPTRTATPWSSSAASRVPSVVAPGPPASPRSTPPPAPRSASWRPPRARRTG